jgi:proteasome assembly chaperone (PAC2) family protein
MVAELQNKAYEFWKKPETEELYMLCGFRQWADAGSVSSGMPQYLVKQTHATPIGRLRSDGFYLFQVPGTHDLMRPVVRYQEGYPEALDTQHNDFYYTGDQQHGLVIFQGDEPHMDVERYVASLLEAAQMLGVKRIVGVGGVYGELPYDKERTISCTYSLRRMREELANLGVTFSDYNGGASIDSVIAKRAGEREMEFMAMYAFVPAYDFSLVSQSGNTIRIENDYNAWLGIMRRVNYMMRLGFDLLDLENKSQHLINLVRTKVDELETAAPQLGVREYLRKLSEEYHEITFNPLDPLWDEELKRLLNKLDEEGDGGKETL